MTIEKKAFRHLYSLILDGAVTEKEAYELAAGIFEREIIQIPTPVPIMPTVEEWPQDSSVEPEQQTNEITVKGFVNNK